MASNRLSSDTGRAIPRLEPRTRRVATVTIRKRWKKLNTGSQAQIEQLLLSLKRETRSTNLKHSKFDEFEASFDDVIQRLSQRLVPRMPVPPATEESYFDYESTLDRTRTLENQLSADSSAIRVLKDQIRREENALSEDKKELQSLQQAFSASRDIQRRQAKNLHSLSRFKTASNMDASAATTVMVKPPAAIQELEHDSEVQPVLRQLRDHLNSIHNNTAAMRPVSEALDAAQATYERLHNTGRRPAVMTSS